MFNYSVLRTIVIPSSATATGTCTDRQQTIKLSWDNAAAGGKVKTGHIVLIFQKGVIDQILSVNRFKCLLL